MARDMRIRTRTQEGQVEVQVLVKHPMDTGLRKDKATNKIIPAHFIKEMTLEHNGKPVIRVDMGVGISTDPLLGFRLKNAKNGDKLKVSWNDNKGEKGSQDAVVDVS